MSSDWDAIQAAVCDLEESRRAVRVRVPEQIQWTERKGNYEIPVAPCGVRRGQAPQKEEECCRGSARSVGSTEAIMVMPGDRDSRGHGPSARELPYGN